MNETHDHAVRRGGVEDAEAIGRLLHDFNREFGEPTPGPAKIRDRVRETIATGDIFVFLAGSGPDGVVVLRFYPGIWGEALECYLPELYVAPERRGQGLGRALMDAALELAREEGADYICLATGEDDVAARGLYESVGFTTRDGGPGGPLTLFYDRDL